MSGPIQPPASVLTDDASRLIIPGRSSALARDGKALIWDKSAQQGAGGPAWEPIKTGPLGEVSLSWAGNWGMYSSAHSTYWSFVNQYESDPTFTNDISFATRSPYTATNKVDLVPGWYSTRFTIDVAWEDAEAPNLITVQLAAGQGVSNGPIYLAKYVPYVTTAGFRGIHTTISIPTFRSPARVADPSGTDPDGLMLDVARDTFVNPANGTYSSDGTLNRSAIYWTITRLA